MRDLFFVANAVDDERLRRVSLSVAAFAYEFENTSIISDAKFDSESRKINPQISTGNSKLDGFFREHFNPSTGSWIHKHPELKKVQLIYENYVKPQLQPQSAVDVPQPKGS
jgi:hypothetical protein